MKRWTLLCGTLLLAIAALILAACEDAARNPFARYPGYGEEYVSAPQRAGGAGGRGGSPATANMAVPQDARPGEEFWIIPTSNENGPAPASNGNDSPHAIAAAAGPAVPGSPVLTARQPDGQLTPMPLLHTDVSAAITGYIASVGVTQQFANPYTRKIEGVYVFPLPESAGVNEFIMTIGDRHIRGIIRERADAEKIYKLALAQGYVASLMTQERPNIFTQKVANIEPGKQIDVHINYFHTLAYHDGWFEWTFPMVVDPRHASTGSGAVASQRRAHDFSLNVTLNAGVPIEDIQSVNHIITEPAAQAANPNTRSIELAPLDAIPNKDFVLRYKVAGDKIKTGMFIQKNKENTGGWFTAMFIPPVAPKYVSHSAATAPPADPADPPALADINFQFAGMQVSNIYPQRIPELFVGKPLIITGRYTGTPTGSITITGRAGNQPMTWTATAEGAATDNPAIATVWARARLADLRGQAIHEGRDVSSDIKSTALEYGIMSEFTNFVAIDTTQKTDASAAARVAVPMPQPDGAR